MHTHIRNARPYIQHVALTEAAPAAASMKAAMLKEGLTKSTINRRLACVRRVLNLAHREWGWLDYPLAEKIRLYNERDAARHVYLSREQVVALADCLDDVETRGIVLLAAYTGLRQGELLSLTQDNWRSPLIVLGAQTKGKRPRTVPLVPELHPVMAGVPFKISGDLLRKRFRKAVKKAGLINVRFHDLRHTFASWLAAEPDVPMTVLRDLLGHSNLTVTSRYSHLRTEVLESAIAKLTS